MENLSRNFIKNKLGFILTSVLSLLILISVFNINSNASGLNLDRNIPTTNYFNYGSMHLKRSNSGLNTSMYRMRNRNTGTEFLAYCIEAQIVDGNYAQSMMSIGDYRSRYLGRYHNSFAAPRGAEFNTDKMRAIMLNSMPAMDIYQIRNASGIPGLTQEEAVRATQYAIWNQTDNLVVRNNYYGSSYSSMPSYRWDNYYGGWVRVNLTQTLTSNEARYYKYLTSLRGVGATQVSGNGISDIVITQQSDGTSIVQYDYDAKIGKPREIISGGRIIAREETESNGRKYVTLTVNSLDFSFEARATVYQKDIAVLYDECGQGKIIVTEVCKEICKSNKVSSGCFEFIKKDGETGQVLPGAEFTLYDVNGNAVKTAVSDANGIVRFDGVIFGNYTMKETQAPEGYQVSDHVYNVEVRDRTTTYIDGERSSYVKITGGFLGLFGKRETIYFTVLNDKHEVFGNLTLNKYDSVDQSMLPGAVFELRNEDGSVADTQVTDENGVLSFANIKPGTYTIVETQAPAGYHLSTDVYTVVVDANGAVTVNGSHGDTISVPNDRILYDFEFLKYARQQDNGDYIELGPLEGAKFEVRDESGNLVQTVYSDRDGRVVIPNLRPGKYIVSEPEPVIDFQPLDTEFELTINEDGTTSFIDINTQEPVGENGDRIIYNYIGIF